VPFQLGLDLPGAAFESWLNPQAGLAGGLAALGKGIGGALDFGLGWDDLSRKAAAKKEPDDVYVDDFGNITESPIPDSTYAGQDGSDINSGRGGVLNRNPMFDEGETSVEVGDGPWVTEPGSPEWREGFKKYVAPSVRGSPDTMHAPGMTVDAPVADTEADPYTGKAAALRALAAKYGGMASGGKVSRGKASTQATTNRFYKGLQAKYEAQAEAAEAEGLRWRETQEAKAEVAAGKDRTREGNRAALEMAGLDPKKYADASPEFLGLMQSRMASQENAKRDDETRAQEVRRKREEDTQMGRYFAGQIRALVREGADVGEGRLSGFMQGVMGRGQMPPTAALKDRYTQMLRERIEEGRETFQRETESRREQFRIAQTDIREGRIDARQMRSIVATNLRSSAKARDKAWRYLEYARQMLGLATSPVEVATWKTAEENTRLYYDESVAEYQEIKQQTEGLISDVSAPISPAVFTRTPPPPMNRTEFLRANKDYRALLPEGQREVWDAIPDDEKVARMRAPVGEAKAKAEAEDSALQTPIPDTFPSKAAATAWLEANAKGLSAEDRAMIEDEVVSRIKAR
jgi:hypothetical protein